MTANRLFGENDPESNQDRFVYYYNTPSLKEMTSYRVAVAVWYTYISKCKALEKKEPSKIHFSPYPLRLDSYYTRKNEDDGFFRDALGLDSDYSKNVEQLVENLVSSLHAKKVLKHFLRLVDQELRDWVEHFRGVLFPPGVLIRRKYRIHHIDPNWCIWLMNGEIDYRKTAKNMINDDGLTTAQKFLVMSEYCMEDEIRRFTLDSLPREFIEQADYNQDPIRFYWICYLKNELCKIPVENHVSPDLFMATNFLSQSRFTNEYFLNRLSGDDRMRIVIDWITSICLDNKNKRDCEVLEQIISKMSLAQQRYLSIQISHTIAIYFSIYSNASQCALWAWKNNCKDQMEVETFAEFLSELLSENRNATSACLLNMIWDTASNLQRSFVVQTKSEEFIDRLLLGDYYFPSVSEFFSKFLQLISKDDKKALIFDRVLQFPYFNCDPDCCSFLVNMCLPCADDQLKFKQLGIDSGYVRNYCEDLFRRRCFEKLNQKLEFYFLHDASAAQAFKRDLLIDVSTNWKYILVSRYIFTREWNKLREFIDESFENDSLSGLKVKQQFISTLASNIDLLDFYLIRDGFDNLLEIVEMVFARDELKAVKRLFSHSFHRLLEVRKVSSESGQVDDEMFINKFIKWCSGDDDELDMNDEEQVSQDAVFDRIRTRSNAFFFSVKIFSEK